MNFLHRINYMRAAKYWIAVSIVLTVLGVGTFAVMGLNKGIDFTGGIMLDIQFEKSVSAHEVESVVAKSVGSNYQVQKAQVKGAAEGGASEYFIRTPELTMDGRDKLYKDLEQVGKYKRISEDLVSGSVSAELTQKAALAVAIAAVLQIIYLWFRFQLKFGLTAVVALLHDLIITLGIVSLFRIQVNSAFVASILTILGYSINDTVIVFDRIREHLRDKKKGEDLAALVTKSIQETITRSIYTVLTVLITLGALLIWGGDTVWDFALTLFIGITSGMYSSIFIASALWLYWQQWDDKRHKSGPSGGKAKTKPVRA